MRQRPHKTRRPSKALRAAAAMAAAAPVLALAPAAQASPEDPAQPRMVVSELSASPLEPGEVRRDSVTLTNKGTAPADHLFFRVRLTRGLDFPESRPGCTYTRTGDERNQALCRLDGTLEPGESTTVPVPIKVLSKALWESVEYGTGATGGIPDDGYSESYRQTRLKANNTADLSARGDGAWGVPGGRVTVRASLRNNGPGWVRVNDSDDQAALKVTVPPGTVAVRVPADCVPFDIDGPSGPSQPGKPQYVCAPPDYTLDVGSVHSYAFTLRIDETWYASKDSGKHGEHTTSGEVEATSVYDIHPEYDHNASNDTAALTVHIRDQNGHGPDSGSGAGPSPSTAAGESASGAHSTTAAGTSQAQDGTRSDGARTATSAADVTSTASDTNATPYVAAAGAVLAAGLGGGLLFVAVRRRQAGSS